MAHHRVCSPERVGGITGAVFVTDESVETGWTESVLAVRPFESRIAQTCPVDVITFGPVLTVTVKGALGAVRADRTFLLAPGNDSDA